MVDDIKLGKRARDKITGFEGIITAKCTYLTGCDQYCITPKAVNGDYKESMYIDAERIEVIGDGINSKEVQGENNGGPVRRCKY